MKKAIVTGANGQDGSYLSELLISKGYKVAGIVRRSSTNNLLNLKGVLNEENFNVYYGDVTDLPSIINIVEAVQPDEFYNLAAMSFVGESWNEPVLSAQVTGMGCLNCLEALRIKKPDCKFYQASTSELFGKVKEMPQTEKTSFNPRSPYGVAKAFAHYATVNYRESYNMFACAGILMNHESERRGMEFVTRKITNGVAQIHLGLTDHITLGNIDAKRDWGYAPDFVKAMYLMLQQEKPDDYIIATGQTRTIKDLLDIAFKIIGIKDWSKYVKQDPKLIRPAEVDILLGDATKAKNVLGWKPETPFQKMIEKMVLNDIEILKK